jgi:hypothetical protein
MLQLLTSAYVGGQMMVRCEVRKLSMTASGHVLKAAARA